MAAALRESVGFFELISDRQRTLKLVEGALNNGMTCLCVTVDAPQLGRRERDMRNKPGCHQSAVQQTDKLKAGQSYSQRISSFIDDSTDWDFLNWLHQVVQGRAKILLKGIQCLPDALHALKFYQQNLIQGIIISNHGGRQLDTCRSGIEILAEVRPHLLDMPVLVDGGVRRGSDIFKCLALGAQAVGLGRPVVYALACQGAEGIEAMAKLLMDELTLCMKLMGCPRIADISKAHVLTDNLSRFRFSKL